MGAVVTHVGAAGRDRLRGECWSQPTLRGRRPIFHAASGEVAARQGLLEILQAPR